jgi:hypothetical protein
LQQQAGALLHCRTGLLAHWWTVEPTSWCRRPDAVCNRALGQIYILELWRTAALLHLCTLELSHSAYSPNGVRSIGALMHGRARALDSLQCTGRANKEDASCMAYLFRCFHSVYSQMYIIPHQLVQSWLGKRPVVFTAMIVPLNMGGGAAQGLY